MFLERSHCQNLWRFASEHKISTSLAHKGLSFMLNKDACITKGDSINKLNLETCMYCPVPHWAHLPRTRCEKLHCPTSPVTRDEPRRSTGWCSKNFPRALYPFCGESRVIYSTQPSAIESWYRGSGSPSCSPCSRSLQEEHNAEEFRCICVLYVVLEWQNTCSRYLWDRFGILGTHDLPWLSCDFRCFNLPLPFAVISQPWVPCAWICVAVARTFISFWAYSVIDATLHAKW